MSIKETDEGVLLKVFVKPRSKNCRIEVTNGEVLLFFCKKPAYRGKANKELIKVFACLFGAEVKIVAGITSNQKVLFIKDLNKTSCKKIINSSQFIKGLPF
jgi:uncharacterized protein (TIGR00251 family)